jgi:transposase
LLSEGQMSDHTGAALVCEALPPARGMIADRGYDSDAFCQTLLARGIRPCISPRKNRRVQHFYDTILYRRRHKIENMFGRIKDWRRNAMRHDRCARTFMSAIAIAATNILWINQWVLTLDREVRIQVSVCFGSVRLAGHRRNTDQ